MKVIRVIAVVLTGALVGLVAGLWLGGHPDSLPEPLVDAFVEEDRALRAEVLEVIDQNFYREVDPAELEEASIRGIVRSLDDRFTHYFTPSETTDFQESISGQFEGVGMSVEEVGRGLLVIQVYEGTPAEGAGIEEGNIVTAVDDESIAGEPADVATAKIKGEPGTSVSLTVLDPETENERIVDVERAQIELPIVETELLKEDGAKVGVARLLGFTHGAHGILKEDVDRLLERGAEGLLLDLRGNGGGLLQEAVLVASVFLEGGEVVTTRGRTKPERVFPAEGEAIDEDVPMVVLVDGGTASASEIVAGALRDHERATLVGERTFGKGSFQEIQPLSNGGVLDLTVGSYFLPDGEGISSKGLSPEVKAVDDPDTERDEAVPDAVDALVEEIQGRR